MTKNIGKVALTPKKSSIGRSATFAFWLIGFTLVGTLLRIAYTGDEEPFCENVFKLKEKFEKGFNDIENSCKEILEKNPELQEMFGDISPVAIIAAAEALNKVNLPREDSGIDGIRTINYGEIDSGLLERAYKGLLSLVEKYPINYKDIIFDTARTSLLDRGVIDWSWVDKALLTGNLEGFKILDYTMPDVNNPEVAPIKKIEEELFGYFYSPPADNYPIELPIPHFKNSYKAILEKDGFSEEAIEAYEELIGEGFNPTSDRGKKAIAILSDAIAPNLNHLDPLKKAVSFELNKLIGSRIAEFMLAVPESFLEIERYYLENNNVPWYTKEIDEQAMEAGPAYKEAMKKCGMRSLPHYLVRPKYDDGFYMLKFNLCYDKRNKNRKASFAMSGHAHPIPSSGKLIGKTPINKTTNSTANSPRNKVKPSKL